MPTAIVAITSAAAASAAATAAASYGALAAAAIGGTVAYGVSLFETEILGLRAHVPLALQSIQADRQGGANPIPVLYGQRRLGGTMAFMAASGEPTGPIAQARDKLNLVLILSEGPIEQVAVGGLDGIWVDEWTASDGRWQGTDHIKYYSGAVGTLDQLTDPVLSDYCPEWTTPDHAGPGIAYLYLRLRFGADIFLNTPTIRADCKGRTVYDPRTDAIAYSNNPALCIRDYLTNLVYGCRVPEAEIDDSAIADAANYCDQMVTVGGVSQARYTLDMVIDTGNLPIDNLRAMLTTCRAFLIRSGGLWRLIIDKPETPAFTFDESNITGGWDIEIGGVSERVNRVNVRYFNAERDYQEEIISIDSPTLRLQDNGAILERTIELPGTVQPERAKQIATINLNQARQSIRAQFNATIQGLKAAPGDVVYINHAFPGWSYKEFRVVAMQLVGEYSVRVEVMEYALAAYDFGTILDYDPAPNTNLPDFREIDVPPSPTFTEALYSTRPGAGVKSKAVLSWAADDSPYFAAYQIEYKEAAAPVWTVLPRTTAPAAEILDLLPATYHFRVKAINAWGAESDYSGTTVGTITGIGSLPADLTGLQVQTISGMALLSWNRATDADVLEGGAIRVKHQAVLSGGAWASAYNIGGDLPGNATSVALPLLSGTYMVKAIDAGGLESPNAAMVVTSGPNPWTPTYLATVQEDSAFAGSGSNCQVDAGCLKLAVVAGAVAPAGTYEFDNSYTAAAAGYFHLEPGLAVSNENYQDLIDARTNPIDSWPDFDGAGVNKTDIQIWTHCKVASGDAWGDWVLIGAGTDLYARYFEFRAELTSLDPAYNIVVSQLRVVLYTY
jgi:hypothetical protein